MTKTKVLFVDDEERVLDSIRRMLRDDFDVQTALSGAEALQILEGGGIGVIVSDCRMPQMNGIELLQRCSKVSPLSVRVMLTGNMDQDTAVQAVNAGDVFKFLNKPCQAAALRDTLGLAVRQYELVTAEKQLLEHTLNGSIKVLADLLGIVKPEAFGRTDRLRRMARAVAAHVPGVNLWKLDSAALLSQLGCVNVVPEILDKLQNGDPLTEREAADFAAHPLLGADLIARIPRLEPVANIILYQNKNYDGTGFPTDDIKRDKIPLEARVLHTVIVHDELHRLGWSDSAIIDRLKKSPGRVDPAILEALVKCLDLSNAGDVVRVLANELELGMIVQEDIKTEQGVMLLCHGQEVTLAIREHLVKFHKLGVLSKPLLVSTAKKPAAANG